MREIKFRAWERYEPDYAEEMEAPGEMHYTDSYGGNDDLYEKRTVVISGFYHDSGWSWGDFEIMQYTGLHDKNGKEIYEGDVVTEFSYPDKAYWTVVWDENAACFELDNGYLSNHWTDIPLEVVGNVYENPDLLTKS